MIRRDKDGDCLETTLDAELPEAARDAEQRAGSGSARRILTGRDRAFLREYIQFGYMHHVIAAEALRSAYERSHEIAIAMRQQIGRTDRPTAEATASRLNDGARVQTVVVARLLSEYASAIEDLGALMHAIRHRRRRGVLVGYLDAPVSAAADVLDRLMGRGEKGLDWLLRLPPLSALEERFDRATLAGLRHDYEALGERLAQIADQYRNPGPQGVVTDVVGVPEDHVAIVLGLIAPGDEAPERRGGLLVQAHNKIKHRFMVIEDIATLGVAAGGNLLYTHYPREPRAVWGLVQNITQVALVGGELAALLLTVDGTVGGVNRTTSTG